ncbi:hypothetical protein BDP81DRAFT_113982 [Colletotrichum phormii]|uniref:Uncharacterized protein n=1 Tax=Colletotrichum phormii TaxID=359342 RepID=A0AAI9ZG19_9PEZI|nr:uncharacterized protein BDP81DRAFT_113982 [Colletotrichum phormii]KAK1623899.1 hypothetical protein BDP81DRAFT_113982 [Colletotrichum phormii]
MDKMIKMEAQIPLCCRPHSRSRSRSRLPKVRRARDMNSACVTVVCVHRPNYAPHVRNSSLHSGPARQLLSGFLPDSILIPPGETHLVLGTIERSSRPYTQISSVGVLYIRSARPRSPAGGRTGAKSIVGLEGGKRLRRGGIEPPAPRRCLMATENFTTKPSTLTMIGFGCEAEDPLVLKLDYWRCGWPRCGEAGECGS